MSTIVVVRKAGYVAIAADTLGSVGGTALGGQYDQFPDKIHQIGHTYMGVCGSAAHHMVVESLIAKDSTGLHFGNRTEIFETLRRIRQTLTEEFDLQGGDAATSRCGQLEVLVANQHGIFGATGPYEVYTYARFWAIGSGREYALGAMHGAYEHQRTAGDIAEVAVQAGAEFDRDTGLPLTVYTLKLKT
jgi:ATP-dependent HslUV protease subunit HslV